MSSQADLNPLRLKKGEKKKKIQVSRAFSSRIQARISQNPQSFGIFPK